MRHYETTEQLIAALTDLHKQATEERSHAYTGSVIMAAIVELQALVGLVDGLRRKQNHSAGEARP